MGAICSCASSSSPVSPIDPNPDKYRVPKPLVTSDEDSASVDSPVGPGVLTRSPSNKTLRDESRPALNKLASTGAAPEAIAASSPDVSGGVLLLRPDAVRRPSSDYHSTTHPDHSRSTSADSAANAPIVHFHEPSPGMHSAAPVSHSDIWEIDSVAQDTLVQKHLRLKARFRKPESHTRVEELARSIFSSIMSNQRLWDFSELFEEVHLDAGSRLYAQGDQAQYFYLIKQGQIKFQILTLETTRDKGKKSATGGGSRGGGDKGVGSAARRDGRRTLGEAAIKKISGVNSLGHSRGGSGDHEQPLVVNLPGSLNGHSDLPAHSPAFLSSKSAEPRSSLIETSGKGGSPTAISPLPRNSTKFQTFRRTSTTHDLFSKPNSSATGPPISPMNGHLQPSVASPLGPNIQSPPPSTLRLDLKTSHLKIETSPSKGESSDNGGVVSHNTRNSIPSVGARQPHSPLEVQHPSPALHTPGSTGVAPFSSASLISPQPPPSRKVLRSIGVKSDGDLFGFEALQLSSLIADAPMAESPSKRTDAEFAYWTGAVCHSPVTCLRLARSRYLSFLRKYPEMRDKFHELLSTIHGCFKLLNFLSRLPSERLALLASLFQYHTVPANHLLFEEGEQNPDGNSLFFLYAGTLNVFMREDNLIHNPNSANAINFPSSPSAGTTQFIQNLVEAKHAKSLSDAQAQAFARAESLPNSSSEPLIMDTGYGSVPDDLFASRPSAQVAASQSIQNSRVSKILHAPTFFGELGLILDLPRAASISSSVPCLILELDQYSFREFLQIHPEILADFRTKYLENYHINLKSMLENLYIQQYFYEFCKGEFSTENLEFWLAAKEFQSKYAQKWSKLGVMAGSQEQSVVDSAAAAAVQSEMVSDARLIIDSYISNSSANQVNLNSTLRNDIVYYISHPFDITPDIFQAAENEILNLMKTDSFSRFKHSALFQECLERMNCTKSHKYLVEMQLNQLATARGFGSRRGSISSSSTAPPQRNRTLESSSTSRASPIHGPMASPRRSSTINLSREKGSSTPSGVAAAPPSNRPKGRARFSSVSGASMFHHHLQHGHSGSHSSSQAHHHSSHHGFNAHAQRNSNSFTANSPNLVQSLLAISAAHPPPATVSEGDEPALSPKSSFPVPSDHLGFSPNAMRVASEPADPHAAAAALESASGPSLHSPELTAISHSDSSHSTPIFLPPSMGTLKGRISSDLDILAPSFSSLHIPPLAVQNENGREAAHANDTSPFYQTSEDPSVATPIVAAPLNHEAAGDSTVPALPEAVRLKAESSEHGASTSPDPNVPTADSVFPVAAAQANSSEPEPSQPHSHSVAALELRVDDPSLPDSVASDSASALPVPESSSAISHS